MTREPVDQLVGSSREGGEATPSGVSMRAMLLDEMGRTVTLEVKGGALEHISGPLQRLLSAVQLELELEDG